MYIAITKKRVKDLFIFFYELKHKVKITKLYRLHKNLLNGKYYALCLIGKDLKTITF